MSANDGVAERTATEDLVASARARVQAVDADILARHAGLSFFDFASCVLGGQQRIDASWATEGERLALEAHALDRDDLHTSALVHPGGIVWPAVISAARDSDVTGAEAIQAVALGYELCVATARLLGPEGTRFWHATALAGTVGAAAAAAWVDGGPDTVVSAVGHAFSITGGSITCMLERSGTRYVHRANAVSAGVLAARAARSGLDGTRFGIESPQGFLAAIRSDPSLAAATDEGLLAIAETGHRLHAACGFSHAAIDAAREIGPFAADEIAGVTIQVSAAGARLAGSTHPEDDADAWWSIPHAVAIALTSGGQADFVAGLSEHVGVTSVMSRCTVASTRDDLGARVIVERVDGQLLDAEVEFATGHPRRPLTTEQRIRKWELLTGVPGEQPLAEALGLADVPLSATRRLLDRASPS